MTTALKSYLANGGTSYLMSADYERRRLVLADMMARGPVSFAEMSETSNDGSKPRPSGTPSTDGPVARPCCDPSRCCHRRGVASIRALSR
jgi:hypothetical protein